MYSQWCFTAIYPIQVSSNKRLAAVHVHRDKKIDLYNAYGIMIKPKQSYKRT